MRSLPRFGFGALAWCLFPTLLAPSARAGDAVLDALREELDRSLEVLSEQDTPAYFLSYEISEERNVSIGASFGGVTARVERERRYLDIDIRVGGYELDNTHPVRGMRGGGSGRYSPLSVPLSDLGALRKVLWFHTDKRYKDAIEQLTRVKTNIQVTVQDDVRVADFSPGSPEKALEDPVDFAIDRPLWEGRLERYTAPFSQSDHVYAADASISFTVVTRWFVNSEGTEIRTVEPYARLFVAASTKAEDGMSLPRYESFFGRSPDRLPDESTVLAAVDEMVRDLEALRVAPLADPYTGPAILSGRASGVFFHEVLGHRVEGHRQRSQEDAQTFKKMLGKPVLPATFAVVFDPTVSRAGSTDLAGSYRYDNQGVKGRRVGVIEAGVLKRFLMSRSPIAGFSGSNGHGRKQAGYAPVSRQSNLLVEVSEAHSSAQLKQLLVDRLREEGKEYGLYFQDIQGGFTFTGRTMPNAFNVLPIMVYRIYPGGREELVRGVDLIGTPLTAFSKVEAASDEIAVFNGTCGAESGGVPVSAVSPEILVSQVEVQKKAKSQDTLPLLSPPPATAPPHTVRWETVR